MGGFAASLFGAVLAAGAGAATSAALAKGPPDETAAQRLQSAKEALARKKEARENRRRASTAKTLTASQRGGSLFPSDFAPTSPTSLG